MSDATAETLLDPDRIQLRRNLDNELAKMVAEIGKISAETSKINAETSKINREYRSYPWVPLAIAMVGSTGLIGAIGAALALVVAFHK